MTALDRHLRHLTIRNLSGQTILERGNALRRLARHLHHEHADDLLAVTRADLRGWQDRTAHYSPRYRASWASHVSAFYAWALDEDLLADNPARGLLTVKQPKTVPHAIGEDDLEVAITCAPDRLRPWLVLMAYAGLRCGEVARLTRDSVQDTADPPVLVLEGKGGRQRVVPMSERVVLELRAGGMPSRGYVFPRHDGQPGGNRPAQVSHLVNAYLHGLGIPETAHSLRHRAGTQLYRASADLRLVQDLLGHESPSTTAGYVAWSSAAAVSAVAALPGASFDQAVRSSA